MEDALDFLLGYVGNQAPGGIVEGAITDGKAFKLPEQETVGSGIHIPALLSRHDQRETATRRIPDSPERSSTTLSGIGNMGPIRIIGIMHRFHNWRRPLMELNALGESQLQ